MLGNISGDTTVVVDFEAGLAVLVRIGSEHLDGVLVVVEPEPKSIEVGRRAVSMAGEKPLSRVIVVANRIAGAADLELVHQAFAADQLVVPIPWDPAIADADRSGQSPVDVAPESPAVRALLDLGQGLSPVAA